ncbi:hypothetical protein [Corynebacterium otitidis]|mgnify:FL=1|uniref:hypothetical protein n=1 Tax=Corynebacterium otitidis TaxID=29321 RepID=UPI000627C12C|nr:hypothetical protein [Corynebacterium otitidis]KKO83592.1 hypothetical protein AAV33_05620 [Corynebacterium otitidis]
MRANLRLAAGLLAVAALSGCASGEDGEPEKNDTPSAAPAEEAPANPDERRAALAEALGELQEQLEGSFDAEVAMAVASGDAVVTTGDEATAQAWSTIKVPIAIAAVREDVAEDEVLDAAIRASDNDAASALWNALGGGLSAAGKVEEVLRDGGDDTEIVEQMLRQIETGDSDLFGMLEWPLLNQARFASHLTCLEGAEPVAERMGDLVEEHTYGLAAIDDAIAKGGWGESDDGLYTNQQLGTVDTEGMAIIAHPLDEDAEEAIEVLDAAAQGIEKIRAEGLVDPTPACDEPPAEPGDEDEPADREDEPGAQLAPGGEAVEPATRKPAARITQATAGVERLNP